MKRVKAVRVNKPKTGGDRRWHERTASKKSKIMKILAKLALTIALLTTAVAAQAEWVSGYVRSNGSYVAPHYRLDYGCASDSSTYGYVYRNPYAAYPSVRVQILLKNPL